MCSQYVFCLVCMYVKINGSVWCGGCRVVTEHCGGLDLARVSVSTPGTEDRRPGGGEVTRGQARLQTGRGWSWLDCRVS